MKPQSFNMQKTWERLQSMECDLVPLIEFDSEEHGLEYSDSEYYCNTCGEYVEGPCEE